MINNGLDVAAIGARWVLPSTAGLSENNHAVVQIDGGGNETSRWQPVVFVANTVPGGASYGNVAIVRR